LLVGVSPFDDEDDEDELNLRADDAWIGSRFLTALLTVGVSPPELLEGANCALRDLKNGDIMSSPI
jgi:hypothetical protein